MTVMKNENKSLITRYYLATALLHADFILPVCLIYPVKQLGFSFTQATSFFVILWISTLLTDFFSGSVADRFSRKKAFICGAILYGAAVSLPFIFLHWYPAFILFAIVAGIGYSLGNGSIDGIVANKLKDDDPVLYRRANSYVMLWLFVSRATCSVLGGLLYVVSPKAPFIAFCLTAVLSGIVALGIEDNSIQKVEQITSIMKEAISVFKKHVVTLLLPVIGLAVSVIGADILFGYYQPFFSRNGLTEIQIGYLFAAASIFSAGGAWMGSRIKNSRTTINIILLFTAIEGLVFAFSGWKLALFSIFLIGIVGGLSEPVTRLIINEHSEHRFRTSALSVGSSIGLVGTLIGYQLSGIFADKGSARSVGLVAVGVQVVALGCFMPYLLHLRKS